MTILITTGDIYFTFPGDPFRTILRLPTKNWSAFFVDKRNTFLKWKLYTTS